MTVNGMKLGRLNHVGVATPSIENSLELYRAMFNAEPDAYALGQYDGTLMALDAIAKGATTGEALAKALAGGTYQGLAMTYKSDGKGNMAHSAAIICYDGLSRLPKVVMRYRPS